MEGGNGVRGANGITQFAEGEPKRWRRVYQNAASRKPPLDGACLGRLAGTRKDMFVEQPLPLVAALPSFNSLRVL